KTIQKIFEACVTVVLPVKLLVGPLQKATLAERPPFGLRQECHVGGREIARGRYLNEGIAERVADSICQGPWARQETRTGSRCERDRDLQLGIIVAARTLKCVGPAMIKYILAARVGLHVARCRPKQISLEVLHQQVPRLPAGPTSDRV